MKTEEINPPANIEEPYTPPKRRWEKIEPNDYILRLVRSFPCLRAKLMDYRPAKFDPDKFHELMAGWSHGERLCGLFILNVWNPGDAKSKGWTFDLMEFAGTADTGNAFAIGAWIYAPIFP